MAGNMSAAAELMHLAGHSSPTVAMRYQHATMERDRAIAERMAKARRAAVSEAEDLAPVASI